MKKYAPNILIVFLLLLGFSLAQSYSTIPVNGSNSFNTEHEEFVTSTEADTGYVAYATWGMDRIYFGYEGSDLGDGDCEDPELATCEIYELGQSMDKWIVYYIDVDPHESNGTRTAKDLGDDQSWTLPEGVHADYLVEIRSDGESSDDGTYTGNAFLYEWTGSAWDAVTSSSGADDRPFAIFHNPGSYFLEFSIERAAIGSPDQIAVVSWFVDTEYELSYAFWPEEAAPFDDGHGTASGETLGAYYGFRLFDGQSPNASNGSANLNRPFFGNFICPAFPGDEGDYLGQPRPFHTITINGSNAFTGDEEFLTSTDAATGYQAYATWDRTKLYLGYTGSDVGGGDCDDPDATDCETFETGQSQHKYIVYFIDTDPTGSEGSNAAYIPEEFSTDQEWTLPFLADYAIYLRTDGSSLDAAPYTGVADVRSFDGAEWVSLGPCPLDIWFNNTSGFVEFAVDLDQIGNPFQIKMVSWFLDAENEKGYAYWPESSPEELEALGVTTGVTTLEDYWGFELEDGIVPNSSANINREFIDEVEDQVTYNTYTVNGSAESNEQLPQEFLGRENEDSPALYLTWNEENLYLSFTGNPLVDTDTDLYLAFDTTHDVGQDPRDGEGRSDRPDVGPAADAYGDPAYPFAANVAFRFAGTLSSDSEVQNPAPGEKYTVEGGAWNDNSMPEGASIIRQENGPTEVAIPWSAVGFDAGLVEEDYFHLVIYLNSDQDGIYAQWPPENPNGQAPDLTQFYSYYLQEGAATFSSAYRSLRTTQGADLGEGLYANLYLIVPNPDQNSAEWALAENTTVVNELYIGQSAILNVGDNDSMPRGHNRLRVGRQFTAVGEFQPLEGLFITFDAAEGYPDEYQPAGGFATPSFTSTIACDVSFYDLTTYNETEFVSCPE